MAVWNKQAAQIRLNGLFDEIERIKNSRLEVDAIIRSLDDFVIDGNIQFLAGSRKEEAISNLKKLSSDYSEYLAKLESRYGELRFKIENWSDE